MVKSTEEIAIGFFEFAARQPNRAAKRSRTPTLSQLRGRGLQKEGARFAAHRSSPNRKIDPAIVTNTRSLTEAAIQAGIRPERPSEAVSPSTSQ